MPFLQTGQKADSKPKGYTVVAFMMDRQPPGVQMELVQNQVSGSAEGTLRQNGKNRRRLVLCGLSGNVRLQPGSGSILQYLPPGGKNLLVGQHLLLPFPAEKDPESPCTAWI